MDNQKHIIKLDYAGINQNHPRLTCITCNKTLLKQPFMGYTEWLGLSKEFLQNHFDKTFQLTLNQ